MSTQGTPPEAGELSAEHGTRGATDGWLEPPQPQDLVVTLLGSYVRGRRDSVWSSGLVRLLAEFGFSTGASRVALARLARRNLITRVKDGRLVSYQVTERTERLLAEGDLRIFSLGQERPNDELITVLWHTLPEECRLERGRLARRLRFLGFGSIQDATWIAPGDREQEVVLVVRDLKVEEHCSLLIGSPSTSLSLTPMIERAWDSSAVDERYRAFIDQFAPYRSATSRRQLDDAQAFEVRTRCIHTFRTFPSLDPVLPESMAPTSRLRTKAARLFDTVYAGLETASLRHFDLVTQPGSGT